jgi:hypothetical protein
MTAEDTVGPAGLHITRQLVLAALVAAVALLDIPATEEVVIGEMV